MFATNAPGINELNLSRRLFWAELGLECLCNGVTRKVDFVSVHGMFSFNETAKTV